jgi:hypothetical protein
MGLKEDDEPWMRNPPQKGSMGEENIWSDIKLRRQTALDYKKYINHQQYSSENVSDLNK